MTAHPRSLRWQSSLRGLVLLLVTTAFSGAQAQLFSDDEARRAILDLRTQVEALRTSQTELNQRLDAMTAGQLGLLQRLEELRAEASSLRGGVEEARQAGLTNSSRQKELFTALEAQMKVLEGRLHKLEPQSLVIDGQTLWVSDSERQRFEQAKADMTNGQLATAAQGFAQLGIKKDSALAPVALYYEGILRYGLKDYESSAQALSSFLDLAPKHPRAPDGMLTLAAAQAEAGQLKAARTTLAKITQHFAGSDQARTAQARLKALPKPAKN